MIEKLDFWVAKYSNLTTLYLFIYELPDFAQLAASLAPLTQLVFLSLNNELQSTILPPSTKSLFQLPSVKVLKISTDAFSTHHDLASLQIPFIFPQLERISIDLAWSHFHCNVCFPYYTPADPSQRKEKKCLRQFMKPLKKCTKLRLFSASAYDCYVDIKPKKH